MILSTVLSAGSLAVAAHGFLLPLEVVPTAEVPTAEVSKSLIPFVSQSQEIDLDCSSCPFALESSRNGLHEWTASQKSDLKLNFATANGKLTLNGEPFYPIAFPGIPPVLSVKQVAKKDEDAVSSKVWEAYPGELKLSYSLEVNDVKHFANPDEAEADLISVTLSIMGLDDQMVHVDDVHIKLLKEANSALHIIDIFHAPSPRPDSQCSTVICRFFAKLTANMGAAKSAAHSAATKVGQKVRMCCLRCMRLFRHASHHDKHQGMKHGGHHNSLKRPQGNSLKEVESQVVSHEQHSWIPAFMVGVQQGISFVIIPMMAGIAFGVVASAVGMLVGQLVVFLWAKFRPAREVSYEAVEDMEKDDLPAYQDVENKGENGTLNEKA